MTQSSDFIFCSYDDLIPLVSACEPIITRRCWMTIFILQNEFFLPNAGFKPAIVMSYNRD